MASVEREVVNIMKSCGLEVILTLPCDKIKNLLALIPSNFKEIPLTREENGVGIAAGLYMAGKKPALMIQSTGIGNSLNVLASLNQTYNIPLPILASWRGVYKEAIPAQVFFGKRLPAILDAAEIPYVAIGSIGDLELIKKSINLSFRSNTPLVVLLSPRLWEISTEKYSSPEFAMKERHYDIAYHSHVPEATHTRLEMIKGIVPYLKDRIVVSNIGIPSKELYAALDQDTNFYMLGSLGLASSIGQGLAMGQEKEVITLDGDGSILMNPNVLASVAQEKPKNLTIICFDNGAHGSTGNQQTFANRMDLELLAKAYGIENTVKASTPSELLKALDTKCEGPRFIHAIILAKNADVPNIPLSPVQIKERLMAAISRKF
ncbi:sulfopyruvate decarboxylase subunit beta [Methanocella conradii]|uniref:sulfopyruvate decarboxylase subunit beta n=1 Tax=Methanocella conradii TaxID=1175444 RepID=UPI00157BD942|nr:sulfopyruvate decarboxylase subunit beta [Methanocella conradii]